MELHHNHNIMTRYNFWFFISIVIAVIVALPILTVFFSFFSETSNYFTLLKNTFLFEYINNSLIILISVLIITFVIGLDQLILYHFMIFLFQIFLVGL